MAKAKSTFNVQVDAEHNAAVDQGKYLSCTIYADVGRHDGRTVVRLTYRVHAALDTRTTGCRTDPSATRL